MSLLRPALLQKLARSRLQPNRAVAKGGVGERRSRAKGSGTEFADHSDYQPGDDIRHLDLHAYSRLGQHVIKRFYAPQQLQVTILVDVSASMGFGDPTKLRRAAELAGVLAYVGLAGTDRVLLGTLSRGRVAWQRHVQGLRRAPSVLGWLDGLRAAGDSRLLEAARASVPRLSPEGLLVVISDWMDPEAQQALATWRTAGQDLVGIQVLAAEELEPDLLGDGPVRLMDAESGELVEATLEEDGKARYRAALASWNDELRQGFHAREGRLFSARSDEDLERIVLGEWRLKRLIS